MLLSLGEVMSGGSGVERPYTPFTARYSLNLVYRTVLSNQQAFRSYFIETCQHGRIHMRDHDRARPQIAKAGPQNLPCQVTARMTGIVVALHDEEIGPFGNGRKRLDPFGVAGIGEHLLAIGNSNRSGRRAGEMNDLSCRDGMTKHVVRTPDVELDDVPGKPPFVQAGERKEGFHSLG